VKGIVVALVLLMAAMDVWAVESGYTLRVTELKAQPFIDAVTVVILPERTLVEIVTRQGAWMQIRTKDRRGGWVRMLSVRLGDPNQKPGGGNILSAIGIGSRPRPQTTATVTTGVRGFSEEDLKQAQPNPAEADRMQGFAADPAQLPGFALRGKLVSRELAYFGEDGKPVEKK
jgi:hypothetical protein